jgi:hypothetical protein
MEQRRKKLLDQVRDVIRLKHYSIRTVQEILGRKGDQVLVPRSRKRPADQCTPLIAGACKRKTGKTILPRFCGLVAPRTSAPPASRVSQAWARRCLCR